ncbi:MAG: hypothetical protein ACRD1A_06750 [Terriglobales bacterium]
MSEPHHLGQPDQVLLQTYRIDEIGPFPERADQHDGEVPPVALNLVAQPLEIVPRLRLLQTLAGNGGVEVGVRGAADVLGEIANKARAGGEHRLGAHADAQVIRAHRAGHLGHILAQLEADLGDPLPVRDGPVRMSQLPRELLRLSRRLCVNA